jgi:hypothetical protein
MTEPIERELRELFHEDARRAPAPEALAASVIRHERRRRVRVLSTLGVAVVSVGTLFVLGPGPIGLWSDTDPGTSSSLCVATYSPSTAVNQRAFSFDGTVSRIGEPYDDSDQARYGGAAVTFTVNEWFRGGSGRTVTVDMDVPDPGGSGTDDGRTPPYAVGSRLLVSGEPRLGGPPLSEPIAWGCGFTRPYTANLADEWRDALRSKN